MLLLDIFNLILPTGVIIATSVIVEKMKRKNKIILVLVASALCLGCQIWALIDSRKDKETARTEISGLKTDLATYQVRVDRAIADKEDILKDSKTLVTSMLDTLQSHGVYYNLEKNKVEIISNVQDQSQRIVINQAPLVTSTAPFKTVIVKDNKVSNEIYIDNKLRAKQ